MSDRKWIIEGAFVSAGGGFLAGLSLMALGLGGPQVFYFGLAVGAFIVAGVALTLDRFLP